MQRSMEREEEEEVASSSPDGVWQEHREPSHSCLLRMTDSRSTPSSFPREGWCV